MTDEKGTLSEMSEEEADEVNELAQLVDWEELGRVRLEVETLQGRDVTAATKKQLRERVEMSLPKGQEAFGVDLLHDIDAL